MKTMLLTNRVYEPHAPPSVQGSAVPSVRQ
jgi:hypothetical protein